MKNDKLLVLKRQKKMKQESSQLVGCMLENSWFEPSEEKRESEVRSDSEGF